MDDLRWIWAVVAIASALLFGEIAGRLVRMSARRRRSGSHDDVAEHVGSIVFWASTAVGLLIAIAVLDRSVLDDATDRIAEHAPRFLLAALVLIGGRAASIVIAAMVGQSARKATGVRQRGLERALQAIVLAAAAVLALTELGVPTALVLVVIVIGLGAPAIAMALLSAAGGRDVAAELAAGRALRHRVVEGQVLSSDGVTGRIVARHATSIELESPDGTRVHLPNRELLERGFELRN